MNGGISFRKPTGEDHKLVQGIWEDPDTMAAIGGVQPCSAAEYARWFESVLVKHAGANCYFLAFSGNDCVGEVSFHRFDRETGTAELNVKTKAAWRGRGIGHRALRFILAVFFNDWGGREMRDTVRETNDLGRKTLLNFGFSEIGRRPRPNGDYLLSLGRDDFNKNEEASIRPHG
jgi:RimJ/RimL family protein N-acetyltransferase